MAIAVVHILEIGDCAVFDVSILKADSLISRLLDSVSGLYNLIRI